MNSIVYKLLYELCGVRTDNRVKSNRRLLSGRKTIPTSYGSCAVCFSKDGTYRQIWHVVVGYSGYSNQTLPRHWSGPWLATFQSD